MLRLVPEDIDHSRGGADTLITNASITAEAGDARNRYGADTVGVMHTPPISARTIGSTKKNSLHSTMTNSQVWLTIMTLSMQCSLSLQKCIHQMSYLLIRYVV